MDKTGLRNFILTIVKPLMSGKLVNQNRDGRSDLDNTASGDPDELSPGYRHTSPFGLIAGVPRGVSSFYQALFGSGHEGIILGFFHKLRPTPTTGQTIVYSTTPDGNTISVTIYLNPDGTLVITAPTKVTVVSPLVDIGDAALEKVLNGETFQTRFNNHQHLGNLGVPTGTPIVQSPAGDLSAKVKAAK